MSFMVKTSYEFIINIVLHQHPCHDLIVIGKHGEAEKDVALLGSVTKHVILRAVTIADF